ncbi:MAG: DNA polymerase III subunit delta [Porticoccaceae bacterium]|nr:DNA polymerase III subunit delta [Porticoccaceae bacterium]
MKIRAEKLQGHLKKPLLPVYVISGNEPLLAQECADAIRVAARKQGFTERALFHFEGNPLNFDWNQLINESKSLSLFSDKKILEVRIPNSKPGDKGSKALAEFCANLNPDNLLLIILSKLEKSAQNSKWIKTLEGAGAHIQVWPVGANQMPRWIDQRLRAANINANQEAIQILADRVEGNLLAAVQEIEKLKLLAPEGAVDGITMSSVVTDSARYNIFEFVDKILIGDAQSAARSLRGLENEGTDAIPLLWTITRELRILIKASELVASGEKSEWALKKSGVWEKRLPLFRTALKRLRPAHLRMLLCQAGAIDRGIKGIRKADVWDEMATLVLSFAGSQTLKPSSIKVLLQN